MKLTNVILGCALVAGMTAGTLQADTVIGNTVFTPLSIKLKIQYNDSKGKVHEASVTSKDLLKILDAGKGQKFATDYDGFGDSADVYLIDKNSVIADLTSEDICSIVFNQIVDKHNSSGKNGSFANTEKGILTLNFDFVSFIPAPGGIVAKASQAPFSGEFSFNASGVYQWQASGGAIKNGDQKISTKLSAGYVSGDGFDSNLAPSIQAKVSVSNGDFLIKGGLLTGVGGGTVTEINN